MGGGGSGVGLGGGTEGRGDPGVQQRRLDAAGARKREMSGERSLLLSRGPEEEKLLRLPPSVCGALSANNVVSLPLPKHVGELKSPSV